MVEDISIQYSIMKLV